MQQDFLYFKTTNSALLLYLTAMFYFCLKLVFKIIQTQPFLKSIQPPAPTLKNEYKLSQIGPKRHTKIFF